MDVGLTWKSQVTCSASQVLGLELSIKMPSFSSVILLLSGLILHCCVLNAHHQQCSTTELHPQPLSRFQGQKTPWLAPKGKYLSQVVNESQKASLYTKIRGYNCVLQLREQYSNYYPPNSSVSFTIISLVCHFNTYFSYMSLLTYFLESPHPVDHAGLQLRDPLPTSASPGMKAIATTVQQVAHPLLHCFWQGISAIGKKQRDLLRKHLLWDEEPLPHTGGMLSR